jgi:hypothetical protein
MQKTFASDFKTLYNSFPISHMAIFNHLQGFIGCREYGAAPCPVLCLLYFDQGTCHYYGDSYGRESTSCVGILHNLRYAAKETS